MPSSDLPRYPDRYSVQIRTRYAECDAMGYLHHSKYWEYFEIVRTDLLRKQGVRYRDLEQQGVLFVVYKAACTYLKPIRYDDQVTVSVVVERITRARVDHSYRITLDQQLHCKATSTLVCVGRDGKPRMMPASLWSESR